MARNDYGGGSAYQLHTKDCPRPKNAKGESTCKCRWRGAFEADWAASGARKRITVTGRSEAEVKRKIRDKRAERDRGESGAARITVKAWADQWLEMKRRTLRPKGYQAAAGSVRTWIVPTLGKRRLSELTPADVRAVARAQLDAGRKGTTAAATQRTLFNMLRDAIVEGHAVPQRVLLTKAPTVQKSDRRPLEVGESLACLAVAQDLPHGMRWVFALLHGIRKAECLGATWDQLDFETGVYTVRWQLQRFPYLDPRDKSKGFRVPDGLDFIHLHKAWHLTPPKSAAGEREHVLLPGELDALRRWREVAPENPWGLIWPSERGTPADEEDDLDEWHAIQGMAGVGHPAGRYYHVHECRNLAAELLRAQGADDLVIQSLLGHTDIATSRAYMRVGLDAKRDAIQRVAGVLGID